MTTKLQALNVILMIVSVTAFSLGLIPLNGVGARQASQDFPQTSIQPLESWERVEEGNVVVFISPKESRDDYFHENVVLTVDEVPRTMTVEAYTNTILFQNSMTFVNFKVEDKKTIMVGNNKIMRVVATYQLLNTKVKVVQYTMITDHKASMALLTAAEETFDRYLAVFEKELTIY